MNQRAILVAVALFVLIIAGMFIFAYLSKQDASPSPSPATNEQAEASPTPGRLFERIEAKHYYVNGVHSITGEIPMPTACDTLSWSIAGFDEGKRMVVSFSSDKATGVVCAQVVTPQRFKVGFKAAADAKIETTFEGAEIPLALSEAAPGESPADFKLRPN